VLRARRRPFFVAATVLVALTVLASFSFPRLAERSNRNAIRAIDDGNLDAARDRALRARFFDPLAVDPIFTLAGIAQRQGRPREAIDRYVQAVELQPENPETWYALGFYEFEVIGNMCDAYRFLNNAYTLDSAGTEWIKGGPLDQARDAVNAGACERGG
jgi:tetratricopeptide (TPR) repeat protein